MASKSEFKKKPVPICYYCDYLTCLNPRNKKQCGVRKKWVKKYNKRWKGV